MDAFPFWQSQAPTASLLFLITLAVSALALYGQPALNNQLLLYPWRIRRYPAEAYRLLTAGFVHGNTTHLLVNMLTFYFFAFILEKNYLRYDGAFLAVYLGSLLAGNVVPYFQHRNDPHYRALGASGAISGVLFSFILFNPNVTLLVFFVLPTPAWLFAIAFVALSFYLDRYGNDNIGHGAHLWGAVAGAVITLIWRPEAGYYFLKQLGLWDFFQGLLS